jgi:hypothetical protein
MAAYGACLSLLDALAKVPSQSDLPTFVTAYRGHNAPWQTA